MLYPKALTWRLVGRLDNLGLSWFFTGNIVVAGTIASGETVTKTVLYDLHERAWVMVPQGQA
ncbi:DUF2061 domain-containing protein [Methylobacterium komagatae]|uniref:DUF2061 domain-containing protein n=1 Tax=Methylobacterium komagatae TaxID=374425 RepID=A0ABW2BF92_9HYPH